MEKLLSNYDLLIIIVYFIILLGIGYLVSRKQKKEDYLIASRNLDAFSTMLTMNASKTGAILMTFVALVYIWGFSAIWYFVGVIFGTLLFLGFALKLKEQSKKNYYTLADYFKYNYSPKLGYFASFMSILIMLWLGITNLIAGAKIFTFFTGWFFEICVMLMVLVVLVYLILGGFKAVVKTDILQYVAMFLILLFVGIFSFKGNFVDYSQWNLFTTNIVTVIGFFIVGIMFPFASPDLWQRVYSARDKKALKKGILSSILVYGLFAFILSVVGLGINFMYPDIESNFALIYGFSEILPPVVLGLGLVLLFSAIMSSIDTYFFTAASSIVKDFNLLNKKKNEISNIRKTLIFLAFFSIIVAIIIKDIVVSSYIIASFYSILGVPTIASWIRPKISNKSLMSGFIFGFLVVLLSLSYFLIVKGDVASIVVILGIISSLIGLMIGGILNKFSKYFS